jgi:hypothetical protein
VVSGVAKITTAITFEADLMDVIILALGVTKITTAIIFKAHLAKQDVLTVVTGAHKVISAKGRLVKILVIPLLISKVQSVLMPEHVLIQETIQL